MMMGGNVRMNMMDMMVRQGSNGMKYTGELVMSDYTTIYHEDGSFDVSYTLTPVFEDTEVEEDVEDVKVEVKDTKKTRKDAKYNRAWVKKLMEEDPTINTMVVPVDFDEWGEDVAVPIESKYMASEVKAGKYKVHKDGFIISNLRPGEVKVLFGGISPSAKNHLRTSMTRNEGSTKKGNPSVDIRNAVGHVFLDKPERARYITYKDGDKYNCSLDNLYWVTKK